MVFRFLVQSLIWGLGDTLRKLQSSNFSMSKHVYLVMGEEKLVRERAVEVTGEIDGMRI